MWFAEFLGRLLGSAVKQMGADGVEALVRGLQAALVEKQVVSRPNADLSAEFDRVRKAEGDRAAK